MPSEQKTRQSLLLVLWTGLAHPSAGSCSPCLCLTSAWLVSFVPVAVGNTDLFILSEPWTSSWNNVNVRGDALVFSHSVLLQILILGDK